MQAVQVYAHGTHANGPKGPTGFSFCLGLFLIIIHLLYNPLLLARVSVIRIPLYHTHAAPELFIVAAAISYIIGGGREVVVPSNMCCRRRHRHRSFWIASVCLAVICRHVHRLTSPIYSFFLSIPSMHSRAWLLQEPRDIDQMCLLSERIQLCGVCSILL